MPERESEVFSNPLPPAHMEEEEDDSHPLTNDDFRKLMMTPRVPQSTASVPKPQATIKTVKSVTKEYGEEEDPATRKKKKVPTATLR